MREKRASALIHIVALVIAVAVLSIVSWPVEHTAAGGLSGVQPFFSELMMSNDSAVMDEDGENPRWVEIHNPGTVPLSMRGYGLSDRTDELRWRFPDVAIEPSGYLVVFLSKKDRADPAGNLHTGFGFSNDETLTLVSPEGGMLDSVAFMMMSGNTSLIRGADASDAWEATAGYTPGLPNTPEAHAEYLASRRVDPSDVTVVLNEIAPVNRTYAADEDGEFPDWIELYNRSASPADISGYGLSDRIDQPLGWRFPEGTVIPGGDYLVIHCSNKNRIDPGAPLHTDFALSSAATTVTLANRAGQWVDEILVQDIPDDASWARDDGGESWSLHREPTPGLPNTSEGRLSMQRQIMAENPGLYVAQVVSRNHGSAADGEETPDWIELYNASPLAVSLQGYGLSDDPSRPLLWRFPDVSVGAGETLLVYADGKDVSGASDGSSPHTSFRLDRAGETLVLASPDRHVIDRIALPDMDADIAYVRVAGRDGFFYCDDPIPGVAPSTVYDGRLAAPGLSVRGGVFRDPVSVSASAEEGATLHYTLDGSEPTQDSPQLAGSIDFTAPGVLRVRAYRSGYIPSAIVTASYLVGVKHDVPVISMVSPPDGLFSYENGIYEKGPGYDSSIAADQPHRSANYYKGWERAASFEFMNASGQLAYQQSMGVKIHGAFSRERDQKSFSVNARAVYGDNRIAYNPFSNRDYTQYKNFILRTSSQDSNRARLRDAALTDAMAEGTGVAYQAAQPAALYINGRYWGHYNLRERVNHHMVANFEGIADPEVIARINVIEGNSRVNNGGGEGWEEIMDFLGDRQLTDQENLAWIEERIDIENYFNYVIMEMWCANSDTGNIRFYQVPGGKWKWILYDIDWAMNNASSGMGPDWDTIAWYTKERGHGVSAAFSTLLIRRLLGVDALRAQFVDQMARLLNGNLSTQHMLDRLNAYADSIEPEMPQHFERWPQDGSVDSWQRNVDRLRTWIGERNEHMLDHMRRYFDLSSSDMGRLFPNGTP